MKLQSLNCPNCNATLEIENGVDTFFCMHCGHKIVLTDMSDAAYRAKIQIKALEQLERITSNQPNRKDIIKTFVAIIGIALILCGPIFIVKYCSNKEEERLQAIVNEVLYDIENENYDIAKIKASSIYYTADWSDEIEDKWDNTREALLEVIGKAENENKND